MKKVLILFIIVIFYQIVFSQEQFFRWGDIPESDIKMNVYSSDPGANAVILQEKAELHFNAYNDELRLFYEITRRIKIINNDGLSYAKLEIPYIGKHQFDEINLFGKVWNLDEKSKLKYKIN